MNQFDRALERRQVLRAAAVAGAAGVVVPLAAGCGGSPDSSSGSRTTESKGSTDTKTDTSTPTDTPTAKSTDNATKTPGGTGPGGAENLGAASAIPVGGGKVFKAQKVVVTQPKKDDYVAFSAICKHKGCVVGKVQDKRIVCLCHMSEYDFATGQPVQGPMGQPANVITALDKKSVKVEGGNLEVS